jgi:hypothetical protein
MARTIQEVNESILQNIAANLVLAPMLTSPSSVSVFRLIAFVVATVIWTLETLFDRHKEDVNAALAKAKPGTAEWYAGKVKEFQQGDQLLVDDEGIHYPSGSSGLKLVFQATAKENDQTGKLFIKVAAADAVAPGGLRALTAAELTQVRGYLNRIRFAGTRIELVSRDADLLRIAGQIYYDPLLDLASVKASVRASLVGYLQKLDFDGQVFKARLEDAIQLATGVKSLEITAVSARSGQGQSVTITRVYETEAGYIVEDNAVGAGFLDTLDFLPYGTE